MNGRPATTIDQTRLAPERLPGSAQPDSDVLVLGLGNILLGDDGVGVHVTRRLAADPNLPAGVRPMDGGTLGFRLLDVFVRSDAVLLVDAADLSAPAGTVRLLNRNRLDRHTRRHGRISAHEAGLADLLTLARLEGRAPARLALVAIQPLHIDWNEVLSMPVARAVRAACRLAIDTVAHWQHSA